MEHEDLEFDRARAEVRLHIVDELIRAHDLGWDLIAAIEQSGDKAEARSALMAAPFGFDAVAAEHVLEVQLGRRTQLGIAMLRDERDDLVARLAQ